MSEPRRCFCVAGACICGAEREYRLVLPQDLERWVREGWQVDGSDKALMSPSHWWVWRAPLTRDDGPAGEETEPMEVE